MPSLTCLMLVCYQHSRVNLLATGVLIDTPGLT